MCCSASARVFMFMSSCFMTVYNPESLKACKIGFVSLCKMCVCLCVRRECEDRHMCVHAQVGSVIKVISV